MTVTLPLRKSELTLQQKIVSIRQAFDFWCRYTSKGFPWSLLSVLSPKERATEKAYSYQAWTFSMDKKTGTELETLIAFWQWLYEKHCLPDYRINDSNFADLAVLKVLDVGTKNGLLPLAGGIFWTMNQDHLINIELEGIEIDPYRLVWDAFSQKPLTRQQQALRWFQEFSAVNTQSPLCRLTFHTGNILKFSPSQAPTSQTKQYPFITHILPFVLPEPCLAWGLPLSLFQPEAIFQKLLSLLSPEGCLIIVNQGEIETQAQEAIFQHVKRISSREFEYHFLGPVPDPLLLWQYPRFAWKINLIDNERE
ncbi:MAG: hypothetical protein K2X01_00765 [Cyanobacteria bacterium]|nr:hypothetical protein [Cyanobacteriota bacterium]